METEVEVKQFTELEKKGLVKAYEEALDIQFGILPVNDEKKKEIFAQAADANRLISLMAGEPVFLTVTEAKEIKGEHPNFFPELLTNYKNGLELSFGCRNEEGVERERLIKLGKEAALQLFGEEEPNIVFALE